MLAQKADALIDAVEIEEEAAIQAKENIANSPFSQRIELHHADIENFSGTSYDLIISNPPFFENKLTSPNSKRTNAMHQEALDLRKLGRNINNRLNASGRAAILLPPEEMQKFEAMLAVYDLKPYKALKIKHRNDLSVFREIKEFGRNNVGINELEICIREADNVTFTKEFQSLLKDYYNIF